MRLYPDEKQVLFDLIKTIPGQVYLFGSRVDDEKKGGDIDLLILSSEFTPEAGEYLKHQFFLQLDSKLDVVVFNPNNLTTEQQAFMNTLNKIRLH